MRWDEELPFIVSEQTGFEEAYIQEVIRCCMVVGLLSKELFESDRIITSKGIQERYKVICDTSRRVCNISEYCLISSEEKPVSSEEKPISSEEIIVSSEETPVSSVKSAQRKGNKKKENINTPQPPKGGGSKKEIPKEINKRARKLFEGHYNRMFSENYYWTAKDAGAMSQLLRKLVFQREQKNMDVSDDLVLYALQYLLDSIQEGWIFENFSVTTINSKFNEIIAQARNGKSSNEVSAQRANSLGKTSQDKTASRESLENLADTILGQLASEECP